VSEEGKARTGGMSRHSVTKRLKLSVCTTDGLNRQQRPERRTHMKFCRRQIGQRRSTHLEAVGGEVEGLREAEEPDAVVGDGLLEPLDRAEFFRPVDLVALEAVVGELALLLGEPAGSERRLGQEGEGAEGDEAGDGALDDEEPAPAGHAADALELEDAGRDDAGEGGRELARSAMLEVARRTMLPV